MVSALQRKVLPWNICLNIYPSYTPPPFLKRWSSVYVTYICLFHSMEITGMLYILPTVVLQVEAYLYYETINKNYFILFGCSSGSLCFNNNIFASLFRSFFFFFLFPCWFSESSKKMFSVVRWCPDTVPTGSLSKVSPLVVTYWTTGKSSAHVLCLMGKRRKKGAKLKVTTGFLLSKW